MPFQSRAQHTAQYDMTRDMSKQCKTNKNHNWSNTKMQNQPYQLFWPKQNQIKCVNDFSVSLKCKSMVNFYLCLIFLLFLRKVTSSALPPAPLIWLRFRIAVGRCYNYTVYALHYLFNFLYLSIDHSFSVDVIFLYFPDTDKCTQRTKFNTSQ